MRKLLMVLVIVGCSNGSNAAELCLSVPDAKVPVILASRDKYNADTNQSLTTAQWVKHLVRERVISDKMEEQAVLTEAAALALQEKYAADFALESAKIGDVGSAANEGWEEE